MNVSGNKSEKKLKICIAVLAVTALCFLAVSLISSGGAVSARLNFSGPGKNAQSPSKANVDINGGNAIIDSDEYVFEPGVKIKKDFYITNNDSNAVYYGFGDISGELTGYLNIVLESSGITLYSANASALGSFNSDKALIIEPGETKNFTVTIEYPVSAGRASQNAEFNFNVICGYAG